MKKRHHILATLLPTLLSLVLLMGSVSIYAESADPAEENETPPITTPDSEDLPISPSNTVSLTAPETIRPGEIVEFTFHCDGEEIRAIQGSLIYDPALLTYESSQTIPEDWKITFSQESGKLKFLGLSTENKGIMGITPLFTIKFRVSENAVTDSNLLFTASDTTAYDGSGELILAGGDFSFTVARPLSTDCTLTSLSIKGGNLSPSFSPEITEYSVKLPYTAHLAEISATACQYGKLKYGNRDLSVGENKVTVTVISETGLQQVYTITVTRASDPNYVPSSDNRLLKLNLSDGLLFPGFSSEITEYTLYMVKGYDLFISPIAADKAIADGLFIRAEASPDSTDNSSTAGTYTIVCYAENGTPRTYTFHTILLNTPEQLEEIRRQKEAPDYVAPLIIAIVAFCCATVFFLGFVMGNALRARKKKNAAIVATVANATEAVAPESSIVESGAPVSAPTVPDALPMEMEPAPVAATEPETATPEPTVEALPEPSAPTLAAEENPKPTQVEQPAEHPTHSKKKKHKKKKN